MTFSLLVIAVILSVFNFAINVLVVLAVIKQRRQVIRITRQSAAVATLVAPLTAKLKNSTLTRKPNKTYNKTRR